MEWTASIQQASTSFVNSATARGTHRNNGPRSWAGTINCVGAVPALFPGQTHSFEGFSAYEDLTDGLILAGDVIVDSLAVNWDWSTVESIKHNYAFSGIGAPTSWASATAIEDATIEQSPSICGTKIEYSVDGTTWVELPNLKSAALNITAANSSFVNSGTHAGGACWTGRTRGPIDWTLSIVQEDDAPPGTTGMPQIGDNLNWRLYTTSTLFWALNFGRVDSYTNYRVNTDGSIIDRTIAVGMTSSRSSVAGQIALPGATVVWP
jgi:hypothetical protein